MDGMIQKYNLHDDLIKEIDDKLDFNDLKAGTGVKIEEKDGKTEISSISGDGGNAFLTEDITTNTPVGNIPANTKLEENLTFTEYVKKLHVSEINPEFTFSSDKSPSVNKSRYVDIINNVTLTFTLTKKGTASVIEAIEFYDNSNTLLSTQPYVEGTNTYSFKDTINSITDDFTYTCKLKYKNSSGTDASLNKTVKFTFKIFGYYGIKDSATISTYTDLNTLTNQNKTGSKGLTWSGVLCNFKTIIYAYPASFGDITKIDVGGFDYIDAFNKEVVDIALLDGTVISYNIYSIYTNLNSVTFIFS